MMCEVTILYMHTYVDGAQEIVKFMEIFSKEKPAYIHTYIWYIYVCTCTHFGGKTLGYVHGKVLIYLAGTYLCINACKMYLLDLLNLLMSSLPISISA